MWHRGLPRVVGVGVASVAVLIAGCGDSPSSPTPTPPSTSSPSTPAVPSIGIQRVAPDAGPTSGGMLIRVSGFGFRDGATLMMGDVTARIIQNTSTVITATTPAYAAGRVDVTVINPDGDRRTLVNGYQFGVFSVTTSSTAVAPGDELAVSWVAPAGRGCNGGGDWIAIYKVGDPDNTGAANGHSDLWYDHLCGAETGTRTLTAPDQPGAYEFRYLVWDTSVARSQTISVLAR